MILCTTTALGLSTIFAYDKGVRTRTATIVDSNISRLIGMMLSRKKNGEVMKDI